MPEFRKFKFKSAEDAEPAAAILMRHRFWFEFIPHPRSEGVELSVLMKRATQARELIDEWYESGIDWDEV